MASNVGIWDLEQGGLLQKPPLTPKTFYTPKLHFGKNKTDLIFTSNRFLFYRNTIKNNRKQAFSVEALAYGVDEWT